MKKIVLVILAVSSFAACKKYTCRCTVYNTSSPEPGGQTSYEVKEKDKKSMCTDKSTQPDSFGNYTTCVLE